MLQPVKEILDNVRLVLASSSPRRSEILRNMGLKFEVFPSKYEENLNPDNFPNHGDFVLKTAFNKVSDVAERIADHERKPTFILGFDTVVSFQGKVFGKPKDKEEAARFLRELSGHQHTVYTGAVIVSPFSEVKFYASTDVTMAELEPDVIEAYVETGEPLDKAGAYGIQGMGGSLIEKIDGDYFNVMGVPLYKTCSYLSTLCKDFEVQFRRMAAR